MESTYRRTDPVTLKVREEELVRQPVALHRPEVTNDEAPLLAELWRREQDVESLTLGERRAGEHGLESAQRRLHSELLVGCQSVALFGEDETGLQCAQEAVAQVGEGG